MNSKNTYVKHAIELHLGVRVAVGPEKTRGSHRSMRRRVRIKSLVSVRTAGEERATYKIMSSRNIENVYIKEFLVFSMVLSYSVFAWNEKGSDKIKTQKRVGGTEERTDGGPRRDEATDLLGIELCVESLLPFGIDKTRRGSYSYFGDSCPKRYRLHRNL